jgi:hypothetical protein
MAWASALWNESDTTSSCDFEASSCGANLASRLVQLASDVISVACCCQCVTSARSDSSAAWASCQPLVDSTSKRCASSTAASRCTCARCCRSSMPFTRSASLAFRPASGSRDSGAPALAASRCQASASAMLSLDWPSRASAFCAHSAAMASWPLARLSSSSFSRSRRAAPLSRPLSSLKTSCICSGAGLPASQSRMRAERSPEVGAVKAPPVSVSRA